MAVLAGIGWLYRGVLADIVANGVHAPSITIALVTAVVIGPVVEEWLFRDLLWRAWAPPGRVAFVRGLGAVVATSLAFAAWHLPFNADAPLLAHALYGGMLAALRWRAGAILPGVVIHAATNALYFVA